MPIRVFTPFTTSSSTSSDSTESCQKSTLAFCSKAQRHSSANRARSDWQRGDHIAGPFERLSILNWIIVLSEIIPDIPPSASTSRTICPFATPPIAGLQDICAMVCMFIVISKTLEPICAAACAASQPACPAPTTITSYEFCIIFIFVSRGTRVIFFPNSSFLFRSLSFCPLSPCLYNHTGAISREP